MFTLHALADGHSFIYIVSRVFDFAEKIKAEDMEEAVTKGITHAMHEIGITPQRKAPITFVPFRDTVQKSAKKQPTPEIHSLTQRIYLEDIARLHNLFALVGFFDGLSKDEGVCMELGYAFGIKKPIILAVTDFVRADYKGVLDSEHLTDPVIEAMASKIIYEYSIAQVKGAFREQLQASLQVLYARIEDEIYRLGLESVKENSILQRSFSKSPLVKYDAYIDFGGGIFEWQRMLQGKLADILCAKGLSCAVSDRYSYHTQAADIPITKDLGWRDINKAEAATVIITCSDSIEMNSGTAAIQGFSRALGKKILLYDSKTTNIVADNNYRSSRNLMIDYSATAIVSRFEEIPKAVEKLLSDSK